VTLFGLALVVVHPASRGERSGWQLVAVSAGAWFVPDTAYSLWSEFWPDALLNFVFALLFAAPLSATYPQFHPAGRP